VPAEAPSDPERRLLDTSVGRLSYTDEGRGEQVVLAVPGLPGTVRDFRWLAPLVAERHRVVRLDLPGFGDSPRTGSTGMTTAQRAEAVLALIDALALERVALLAHSSGSTPAARIAGQRADLVDALVLLAPTGPRPHYSTRGFRALAAGYRLPLARALLDVAVRQVFAAAGFPRSLTDDERRNTVLDAAAVDFAEHSTTLGAVAVPTLVCWAEDDPVIPSAVVADLVTALPRATAVRFATGGHNVQKTQAGPIADAMLELLASAEPVQ
jgi:pimeloyl-ACP methyl ester carboxylesterase